MRKIGVLVLVAAAQPAAAHHRHVGGLGGIAGVQPDASRLSVPGGLVKGQVEQPRIGVLDDLGMGVVAGLDHPAEDLGAVVFAFGEIAAVLQGPRQQFPRIVPPFRPDPVVDVLLDAAQSVGEDLGDDGDMAGHLELAALVPDQQAARFRRPLGAVAERAQRQPLAVRHPAHPAQAEDVVGHGDVVEDVSLVEVQPASRQLDALPLVTHEDAVDVAAVVLPGRQLRLVGRGVVRRIDRDAARPYPQHRAEPGRRRLVLRCHGYGSFTPAPAGPSRAVDRARADIRLLSANSRC